MRNVFRILCLVSLILPTMILKVNAEEPSTNNAPEVDEATKSLLQEYLRLLGKPSKSNEDLTAIINLENNPALKPYVLGITPSLRMLLSRKKEKVKKKKDSPDAPRNAALDPKADGGDSLVLHRCDEANKCSPVAYDSHLVGYFCRGGGEITGSTTGTTTGSTTGHGYPDNADGPGRSDARYGY